MCQGNAAVPGCVQFGMTPSPESRCMRAQDAVLVGAGKVVKERPCTRKRLDGALKLLYRLYKGMQPCTAAHLQSSTHHLQIVAVDNSMRQCNALGNNKYDYDDGVARGFAAQASNPPKKSAPTTLLPPPPMRTTALA